MVSICPLRLAHALAYLCSSNLLFPKEDKAENKLLFACRTCAFTEEAASSCVMRHEIASTVVCHDDWAPGYMLEAEDEPAHVEPEFYMDHDFDVYDDDFFDEDDMEDVYS